MANWVAAGQGEPGAGLVVILQERFGGGTQVRTRPTGQLVVLGRVVVGLASKELESKIQRPIAKVRLIESERKVACLVAQAGLHTERFTETEKIIGLIIQPQEGPGKPAYAAVQSDAVLTLFLN